MKRHIGKIVNTDQRCVIAFMQIPGKESHALIIPTESLPPRYEQALMEIVESQEGQADATLANVLGRRMMPDTGKSVLESFHNFGYMHPIPIDNIVMLPAPNMPFPLRSIIEKMGGSVPTAAQVASTPIAMPEFEDVKYNPYGQAQLNETNDTTRAIGRNLLAEAELMEGDIREIRRTQESKREQAYAYDPSLRPKESQPVSGTNVDLNTPAQLQAKATKTKAKPNSTAGRRKGPAQRRLEEENAK